MEVVITQENSGKTNLINQVMKGAGWCYMCKARKFNGILTVGVPNKCYIKTNDEVLEILIQDMLKAFF